MAKNAAEGAGMPADALDALEAAVNHNLDLLHQTLNDKIMELQEARKVGRVGEGVVQGRGCGGKERDSRCWVIRTGTQDILHMHEILRWKPNPAVKLKGMPHRGDL